ncbi:hypothetical protein EYF80_050216 [Liparis tanakae]|uniref:Uncharacterized protein n=1 Tax=Liparis tanakae TaxID=230148 RepID=A0A4Z2FEI2_9TELE|nr:hypothetical protein EYF80_050216 [Liparis tanakae]
MAMIISTHDTHVNKRALIQGGQRHLYEGDTDTSTRGTRSPPRGDTDTSTSRRPASLLPRSLPWSPLCCCLQATWEILEI